MMQHTSTPTILPISRPSESSPLMNNEFGYIGETNFHKGWTECANILRERDEDNLRSMSDELDSFLAFSGIFSAVITLFVSQSTTSLQPDNSQLTIDILRTISQQIANNHTAAAAIGASIPPFRSAPFDTVLNSLLNAGLLCSLIASGMSLWVKQWLREHALDEPPLPRRRARVRLFRHRGLRAWRMRGAVASISLLLQLSVLLFSAGVVMLAHKMDATLAWVLLGLNAAWWALTWGAALCPTFCATAPFRSPLSRAVFRTAHQVRRTVGALRAAEKEEEWGVCGVGRFRTFEERELHETARDATGLELEALGFANREFWGSERLEVINECFREVNDRPEALRRIEGILGVHYRLKDQSDTFESKGARGLQTEDKCVKQLMRIWCDIWVQEHGKPARETERYKLFNAVSGGIVKGKEVKPEVTVTVREGGHRRYSLSVKFDAMMEHK